MKRFLSKFLFVSMFIFMLMPEVHAQKAKVPAKCHGVFALIPWNKTVETEIWEKDFVDGVTIRTTWGDLEPEKGKFNWKYLDENFEKAIKHKKYIRISLAAGYYSPEWILNDKSIEKLYFDFELPKGLGKTKDETGSFPAPWDKQYQKHYADFIKQLAARYEVHKNLAWVSVAGPGSYNDEVSYPREKEHEKQWLKLASGDIKKLRKKLLQTWYDMFHVYDKAFKKTHFSIALVQRSLPVSGKMDIQQDFQHSLIEYGHKHFPNKFAVQVNGLDAWPLFPSNGKKLMHHKQHLNKIAPTMLTGYQSRAPNKMFPNSRTGSTAAEKQKIMRYALLKNGLQPGINFIEIYKGDILDKDVSSILRELHLKLTKANR